MSRNKQVSRENVARKTGPSPSESSIDSVERPIGKPDDYYYAERIDSHRIVGGSKPFVEYEVKWLGYGPEYNTFEIQRNLDGSKGLLHDYHKIHRRALKNFPIEITEWCGFADEKARYNRDAWCTPEDVVERLSKEIRDNGYSHTNLPIFYLVEDHLETSHDCLIIFNIEMHLYAGLYLAEGKCIFVGDGENKAKLDEVRRDIKLVLGDDEIEVIPVIYERQSKVDYCGSSACCIGYELARLYRYDRMAHVYHKHQMNRKQHYIINVSKRVRERAIKSLNGKNSAARGHKSAWKFHRCPHCKWAKQSGNRRALTCHLRNCAFKESTNVNQNMKTAHTSSK